MSSLPIRPYEEYETIFAEVEAPFAFVDLDAMGANAAEMLGRAGGKPIRVASKSLRCRALLERILRGDPGFEGLMTFTLPETLWLAEQGFENLLLAYPTADAGALGELALRTVANPGGAPIVMVDCAEHLDAIESVLGAGAAPVRALRRRRRELVRRWAAGSRRAPERSPVHTVEQAVELAREIDRRPQVELVAMMAYEGQIAGVGDLPPGRRCAAGRSASCSDARRRAAEPARRRSVARSARLAELPIVNGGGTGSLRADRRGGRRSPRSPPAPGFYAPTLFDAYRASADPGRRLRAADRATPGARASRPCSVAATSPPARPSPAAAAGSVAAGRAATRSRGGRRRGADAAARTGRGTALDRRPGLPPPRQGGRAVRALRRPPPGRGRRDRRRGAHLPGRGQDASSSPDSAVTT